MKLNVIQARDEDVLEHSATYKSNCKKPLNIDNTTLIELPGNHNFDAPNREGLMQTILDILVS